MADEIIRRDMSKFTQRFGPKPIFAGVYPTGDEPVKRMLEEIAILADEKVTAVYLENVNKTPEDIRHIKEVLELFNDPDVFLGDIQIGVNILPDHHGKEYQLAFKLAKKYGLSFIALDMIAGPHMINQEIMEIDAQGYRQKRKNNIDIIVLGGICPPYSQLVDPMKSVAYLKQAAGRSDAVLVKAQKGEEIPLERIIDYRNHLESKSLVGASNLTKKNMPRYAPVLDGFIIGSGLRDDARNLHVPTIREINAIVSDYREYS